MDTQRFSKLVLESFNIDIQKFLENLIKKSSETNYGSILKQWANENKLVFEVIIRTLSVLIQENKLSLANQNPINSLLIYHLERLPREVRRIFLEDGNEIAFSSKSNNNDKEFKKEFENAIEDLGPDELRLISTLDNRKIKEFVDAPKKLRPFLLEKWSINEVKKIDFSFLENVKKITRQAKEGGDSFLTAVERKINTPTPIADLFNAIKKGNRK